MIYNALINRAPCNVFFFSKAKEVLKERLIVTKAVMKSACLGMIGGKCLIGVLARLAVS